MCKVLFIAGIKKEHQDKVKKLLPIAAKKMSEHDEDGVGYAAITKTGKIYGEKWLNKTDAFLVRQAAKSNSSNRYIHDLVGEASKDDIDLSDSYMSFGSLTKENQKNTTALILHARRKTIGEKSLSDTHPFYQINDPEGKTEDTAIIHNGTITNHQMLTKKMSTCDSEVILHEYLKFGINYNPYNISQVTTALKGEYTVGALSSYEDGENVVPVLDIFKSKKDLCVGYCPDLETAVFCTYKYLLENIMREAGLKIETIVEIRDEFLIRLNAITGERLEDLIPFKISSNVVYMNDSAPKPPQLPASPTNQELTEMRENFEQNHPDIFNTEYLGANLTLTDDELKTLELMNEVDDKLRYRAAKLIKRVVEAAK